MMAYMTTTQETTIYTIKTTVTQLGYTIFLMLAKAPTGRSIVAVCNADGVNRFHQPYPTHEEARSMANSIYHLFSVSFAEEDLEIEDLQCCSICDGVGHGYPGGGPCPLEQRGADDGFDQYEADRGVIDYWTAKARATV